MTYKIYHICRECDKNDFTKGYIGITKRDNVESRWKEHRKDKSWYNDYTDIIEYVIKEGTKAEILELEEILRPVQGMGWNKMSGGGLPVTHPANKYARYGKVKRKLK